MKDFVKAKDREGSGFAFLQEKFPLISVEKLKAGIFDSLKIRELMKDPVFDEALRKAELFAWQSLKSAVTNFLGNHRSAEYEKENWRTTKEFLSTRGTNVSQTVLSAVTLGIFF